MISEIIRLRKELHQFPELSGSEFDTAQRIARFILNNNPTEIIQNIGGHGLAAVYKYSNDGPTVTIRCELDALPIQEQNTFHHRSMKPGVSHKCGHDGHMAIVAGLIFWLKAQAFSRGRVVLLFQPAEETGQGAKRVIEDPKFKKLKTDFVFALHNIPGVATHNIIVLDKGFSAEVQSFSIILKGRESHAAEPENGINPAQGIPNMISAFSKLNKSDPLKENFTVLTPVYVCMGQKSYGISPANGELHYTIRTWDAQHMEILKTNIEGICNDLYDVHRLKYEVRWFEYFPTSKNDLKCNQYVVQAAQKSRCDVIRRSYPFKFGEDFGWFSKKYKTAMFGIGAGLDSPTLHHADYDFSDEIIETGINMFSSIIQNILKPSKSHYYD